MKICSINSCNKKFYALSYCKSHYDKYRYDNNLTIIRNKQNITEELYTRQLETTKQWKLDNKDYYSIYQQNYRKRNTAKRTCLENKRRAAKINATPKWLTKEQLNQIEDIYLNRPKGYHVDHIVPLQGENVRGLHVPWNLQYLPANINNSKYNKWRN